MVCHSQVTASPISAPLKAFPVEDAWQAEPTAFSHAAHLDAGKMERAVGFHVGCADRHFRDDSPCAPTTRRARAATRPRRGSCAHPR